MTIIKPINKNILIKMADKTDVSKGGIIMTGPTGTKREQSGVVIIHSDDCELVSVGMKVLFEHGQFKLMKDFVPDKENEYAIINEKHVIGVFENE